jgi:DUF971 family protein
LHHLDDRPTNGRPFCAANSYAEIQFPAQTSTKLPPHQSRRFGRKRAITLSESRGAEERSGTKPSGHAPPGSEKSVSSSGQPVPQDLRADTRAGRLEVDWNDAHQSRYPFKMLRCACGCAHCVDEITGVRILDPASIPEDISIGDIQLVGNYAVRITWTDGHDTGLYSWSLLRRVCPCEACQRVAG